MNVAALIRFYQELSPESLARLPEFYGEDAFFKDPFNEVRGIAAIQRIFVHMFEQVTAPRFEIVESIEDAGGAMIVWEFHFSRRGRKDEPQLLRGVSHLRFGADGKIDYHRDYWDAAEELYMKLPVIGWLMRRLQRLFRA